ncbi:MAG: ABC transporter substrate-binding protein [Rickettsiales bacterium]
MRSCMVNNSFFKRLLSVAAALMIMASSAEATEKEAMNFINDLAERAIDIVKKKDLNDDVKEKRLTEIFLVSVDTQFIGKFSMGRYWRTINPVQQAQYLKLYSQYLTGMYVPNFKKYTGNNVVKVLDAKKVRENEYFVQTEIDSGSGANNIQINYMLRQDPKGIEKFIIFDIIAEGVSLITSQRSEIGSIMDDGGFDHLISLLNRKIETPAAS